MLVHMSRSVLSAPSLGACPPAAKSGNAKIVMCVLVLGSSLCSGSVIDRTAEQCVPFDKERPIEEQIEFNPDLSGLPASARVFVCGVRRPSTFLYIQDFFTPGLRHVYHTFFSDAPPPKPR